MIQTRKYPIKMKETLPNSNDCKLLKSKFHVSIPEIINRT